MNEIDQIAVFLDVENLINFCHELQLPIELNDVLEKLKDEGRVTVRRSFGDVVKPLAALGRSHEIDRVRKMLRDNLFLHEDIPYTTKFKNSADMRLAVEALYTAFTLPSISKFAIIAGDSDYVPLFVKLKEQNKAVIGISGSDLRTAQVYRKACDSLFYFEDIARAGISPAESIQPDESAKPIEQDTSRSQGGADDQLRNGQQTLRDEFATLLVRAVEALDQGGKQSSVSAVQSQMKQMQADFDPARAGFRTFRELVSFAADGQLVTLDSTKGDDLISLPGQTGDDGNRRQVVSTAKYRVFLQEKLRCQLPSHAWREHIASQAFDQITYSIDDGGTLLRHLSTDVTDELISQNINIPQPEVFKYLYTLFRARCFSFEENEPYNPRITGFRSQASEWDDHFVSSQLRSIADAGFAMFPAKLSQLFYETEVKSMHVKQLLNALGIKFEVNYDDQN